MSSKETIKAIIEVLKDKTQDINHCLLYTSDAADEE